MVNYSTSEENYIKAIFHLQEKTGTVTTNALANTLQTKPASVTDMLKKLKTKKLVHYEPYQGFRLSQEGRKVAIDIIRRHRLWEYFLAEKLNFDWNEVHEVAEHLEHVSSKKLIDKLDEYLGHPKFDPHGDPIPDSNGKMKISKQLHLAETEFDRPVTVTYVSNQSKNMLELLNHRNISIGTILEVKKKFQFDHSLEIKIKNQPVFTISESLAKNIYVKYDQK